MTELPYVASLRYLLDSLTPYEAEPIEFEADDIQFRLRDNVLQGFPNTRISTVGEARRRIEKVLRNWTLQAQLLDRSTLISFRYQDAETVGEVADTKDYSPENIEHVEDRDAEIRITIGEYPVPPEIEATPEIEAAADRLKRAVYGGESLQSAAYFALTIAENSAGNRQKAASQFQIDIRILSQLGLLSSTTGDLTTARKASAVKTGPLTPRDKRWVDRAVRNLLLQIGQVNAGRIPVQINLRDLG
jgi:hypothetical protein